MKLHRNAALSWNGRRQLAVRVVEQGSTVVAAAEAFGVSVRWGFADRHLPTIPRGAKPSPGAEPRTLNRRPRGLMEWVILCPRIVREGAERVGTSSGSRRYRALGYSCSPTRTGAVATNAAGRRPPAIRREGSGAADRRQLSANYEAMVLR